MTPSPGEALIDHGAAKREAHYLATPGPDDYISADLLNLARAYLALAALADVALDHVALWQAQKISGASRAERNAAIEDSRQQLIDACSCFARTVGR